MASNDLLLGIGAAACVGIAYVGNVGGFKTWADSAFNISNKLPIEQQPHQGNCYQVGGYTVWKGQGCDQNNVLKSGLEYAGTGSCAQIREQFLKRYACKAGGAQTGGTGCYNHPTLQGTCWRNVPCGGKTTIAWCISGRNQCEGARAAWLAKYGCKSKRAFAYEGVDNVSNYY